MEAEIISNLGATAFESELWIIILFLFLLLVGLMICFHSKISEIKKFKEKINLLGATLEKLENENNK
ncbi:MAG TPA: hypothetical protein VMZ91_12925 [Candidatus Paceibacterota bacterium]|nr:hypothetical protein [Candidatus Paceibacterota bacterium]